MEISWTSKPCDMQGCVSKKSKFSLYIYIYNMCSNVSLQTNHFTSSNCASCWYLKSWSRPVMKPYEKNGRFSPQVLLRIRARITSVGQVWSQLQHVVGIVRILFNVYPMACITADFCIFSVFPLVYVFHIMIMKVSTWSVVEKGGGGTFLKYELLGVQSSFWSISA